MLYLLHDASQLMLAPARTVADLTRAACENPFSPLAYTPGGRALAASVELFERTTRPYPKPAFNLPAPGRVVWQRPFGRVIAFGEPTDRPKLLIVAPMSGHHATLLRGTVAAFLDTHQVFVTDWSDAKEVPVADGVFDLSDYVDYCLAMFEALGPDLHVMAVCQPAVPVLAAIALMEAEDHPLAPRSATLLGGPVDTRRAPTAVNAFAQERDIAWFRRHCIHPVPDRYKGRGRLVYPGFLQLSGFMAMNPDRHLSAHWEMFNHLVEGDGDSADRHRAFYDEYLAVMDLTAEFYLQTLETVFLDHLLPTGRMRHRGRPVDLAAIRRCALMAVEGENDDIVGRGQTIATLDLTPGLPAAKKDAYLQASVGHYGVFNGARFRTEITPRIKAFIARQAITKALPLRQARRHAPGVFQASATPTSSARDAAGCIPAG
ncbi:polyhydroxyalkanoate depolymerase [Microvirga sp. HBU67558]|uniref:polyhydroxyalkanoate depolymerase n=1 Tax=Microvirga TaxID=186650 RepID=UPI001B396E1E|nr:MULTISPECIES: polyhydroxyalkanoate depolymerase [unclassified Microvirga]MBQ0822857.1 polyhydroxyalkanoate depolymerase [Microvirga sp. HBU67558]